jgi:glycosyltransferase involved in cell wall biosynthesis
MKKYPKISIVIPSYNKQRYLKQTLDSILQQEYANFEVIIQDGGSTDGSLGIIKEYANKHQKVIRYESKKDNGQLDAINEGVKKTTGDIISFINADDIYLKNCFKTVSKIFLNNPGIVWVAGGGIVINEGGKESESRMQKYFVNIYKNLLLFSNRYSLLLCVNYLMQPSVFVSKQAINKYGPFKGNRQFVAEYEMWLRLGKVIMPIVTQSKLSGFRLAKGNISTTNYHELLREDYRITQKFTNNKLILLIHKLNNIGRILVLKLFKL